MKTSIARFEVYYTRIKPNEFAWHLKHKNGKILCQAHGFNTKQEAKRNIKRVIKYFSMAIPIVVVGDK